jgi:hypothetical protein
MRAISLVKTSAVTQEDFDRIEADALLKATKLERQQIEHRGQILKQNLFPSNLSDGVLQVQNRIHNLQMEILVCK